MARDVRVGPGLFNCFRVISDAPPGFGGEDLRRPGEGNLFRPGEVIGGTHVERGVPQHRHSATRDVLTGNGGDHAVAGRPADHPVLARQERQEVQVEVVAQEREVHAGCPDPRLGGVVVAAQVNTESGAAP